MADTSTTGTKARRHPALQQFFEEVRKGFIEIEATVAGFKFVLRTLNDDEESWSDGFIRPASPIAYVSSRKDPRLACAVKSVNGIPLDQLFTLDDSATQEEKDRLKDPVAKMVWLRLQMMLFLAQEVPPPVTDFLYKKYEELTKQREQALSGALQAGPNS